MSPIHEAVLEHSHLSLITVVLVGETQSWIPELINRAQKLKVDGGFEKGTDLSVDYLRPT